MDYKTLCILAEKVSHYRGNAVLIYFSPDIGGKVIDDTDSQILHNWLREMGPITKLDFLLNTPGGSMDAAKRLTKLLHNFVANVNVVVISRAASAGTLLTFSAHEIVMGSMAELTPIDPILSSANGSEANLPQHLSSEDIRAFIELSKEWFGIKSEKERREVLALLCQKIYPTTLSHFYRSERHLVKLATDLLLYHLPESEFTTREKIVKGFIHNYHSHTSPIFREDAKLIGLNVSDAGDHLEETLSEVNLACQEYILSNSSNENSYFKSVSALLFSKNFFAYYVYEGILLSDNEAAKKTNNFIQGKWIKFL